MKYKYIIGIISLAGAVAMTSCDDFLNDNRYPLSQQTVNAEFWNNSVNVQNQINYFYEDYSGYEPAVAHFTGAGSATTRADAKLSPTGLSRPFPRHRVHGTLPTLKSAVPTW